MSGEHAIIWPAREADLNAVLELTRRGGTGLTNLRPDRDTIQRRYSSGVQALEDEQARADGAAILLVTELDPDNDGRPAHAMLLADGFRDEGYVNIFDGGPAFVAPIDEVAKITARREATYLGEKPCGTPRLIATGHAQDFRLLGGGVSSDDDRVKLDPSAEGHPAFRAAKHSTSHQRRPAHND